MKIAFLQRELPSTAWNGVATQVHDLANALVSSGHKVTVFSISPKPTAALYEVHKLEWPDAWNNSKVLKRYGLGWLFKQEHYAAYDVVHAHGDNPFLFIKQKQVRTFYGSALAECLNAQTVTRAAAQLLSWPLEWLGVLAADYRTAISPGTRNYLPTVDRIVPCGVDRSLFYPCARKTLFPSVAFVGGLSDRKRGRWLIKRWPEVSRLFPEAQLRVIGPEEVLGIGITYLGPLKRNELAEQLASSWLLVSPSSYEGFGLPLLEAMACGTAVVATPNDGSRYLLQAGEFGELATDEHFTEKILELLASKEKRDVYCAAGLKRAEEWDILKVADIYTGIYERLIRTVS